MPPLDKGVDGLVYAVKSDGPEGGVQGATFLRNERASPSESAVLLNNKGDHRDPWVRAAFRGGCDLAGYTVFPGRALPNGRMAKRRDYGSVDVYGALAWEVHDKVDSSFGVEGVGPREADFLLDVCSVHFAPSSQLVDDGVVFLHDPPSPLTVSRVFPFSI